MLTAKECTLIIYCAITCQIRCGAVVYAYPSDEVALSGSNRMGFVDSNPAICAKMMSASATAA
jgi:hypothetical protein